jgi:hypothetical protein
MNKNIVKVIVIIIILVVFGVIGLIIYLLYRSHKSKSTTSNPSNPSNQQTTFSLSNPSRIYISDRCLLTDGFNLKFDDCSALFKDDPVTLWSLLSNGKLVNRSFQIGTTCVTPKQASSMVDGTPLVNNNMCMYSHMMLLFKPNWNIKDNKLVYSNGLCLGSNSSHEAILTSCDNAPILSNSPIT